MLPQTGQMGVLEMLPINTANLVQIIGNDGQITLEKSLIEKYHSESILSTMLNGPWTESQSNIIELKEFSLTLLLMLKEYFENGFILIDQSDQDKYRIYQEYLISNYEKGEFAEFINYLMLELNNEELFEVEIDNLSDNEELEEINKNMYDEYLESDEEDFDLMEPWVREEKDKESMPYDGFGYY